MIDFDHGGVAGAPQDDPTGPAGAIVDPDHRPLPGPAASGGLEQPTGDAPGVDIVLHARSEESTGEPDASKSCSIDDYCDYLKARYWRHLPAGEVAYARLVLKGWTPPELDRMWIPQ